MGFPLARLLCAYTMLEQHHCSNSICYRYAVLVAACLADLGTTATAAAAVVVPHTGYYLDDAIRDLEATWDTPQSGGVGSITHAPFGPAAAATADVSTGALDAMNVSAVIGGEEGSDANNSQQQQQQQQQQQSRRLRASVYVLLGMLQAQGDEVDDRLRVSYTHYKLIDIPYTSCVIDVRSDCLYVLPSTKTTVSYMVLCCVCLDWSPSLAARAAEPAATASATRVPAAATGATAAAATGSNGR
jgi:hypothetical protein